MVQYLCLSNMKDTAGKSATSNKDDLLMNGNDHDNTVIPVELSVVTKVSCVHLSK